MVRSKNEIFKKNGFYCIPTEKLSDVKNSIENVLNTTARELGKACGKLISMKFGLGDIVQLKSRNLYQVTEKSMIMGLPSEFNKLRKGN